MTDKILPLGYPPKTRRVCQPYMDQIAALSARLADAEAALATARADALRDAAYVAYMYKISEKGHNEILAMIPATPPDLS